MCAMIKAECHFCKGEADTSEDPTESRIMYYRVEKDNVMICVECWKVQRALKEIEKEADDWANTVGDE